METLKFIIGLLLIFYAGYWLNVVNNVRKGHLNLLDIVNMSFLFLIVIYVGFDFMSKLQ